MIRETTYCIIRKNAGGAMLTAGIFISALLLAASSCTKTEVSGDEGTDKDGCIAFYLNAHPTKAIIEDTEKLYELAPPIYVTENLRLTDFNNTMIEFTGNGVWRSDVEWASGNLDYSFYAYTYSLGRGTISSMVGNGAVANNGKTVTITQPVSYQQETAQNDVWTDFLMSYMTNASSANPGLVNLEFERVTTGVELYISKSPVMGAVTLKSAQFSNVVYSATYNLTNPASSTESVGTNGMKNGWTVSRKTGVTTYGYPPAGTTLQIEEFDPDATQNGRFTYDQKYRIMNFLTVHQPVSEELDSGERKIILSLSYSVEENGRTVDYDVDFDLADFTPSVWSRGHKIRYYLSIDTSTELQGTIAKWQEVDFIESTLLPDTVSGGNTSGNTITGTAASAGKQKEL